MQQLCGTRRVIGTLLQRCQICQPVGLTLHVSFHCRGATRRSLVIMDELGRGTSTFDGTAIASASVAHLIKQNQCLCLFATHYHSLLDEWKKNKDVLLGHMECLVDDGSRASDERTSRDSNITFLYTLGNGVCPKSFGINVARMAEIPEGVLENAERISTEFEEEMRNAESNRSLNALELMARMQQAIADCDWDALDDLM